MNNAVTKRYVDMQYDALNNVYWCPSCGKIVIGHPVDKMFCTLCSLDAVKIHIAPSTAEAAMIKKGEARLTKEDLVEILI